MPSRFTVFPLVFAFAALIGSDLQADDAGIEFFEKKIRPVLVAHCYECHAAGAKKIEGELLLDSRGGTRKGGEGGAAVVPGKLDESLLITAIRYDDEALQMPPSGKLPAEVIADFEEWVKRGAPDPREGTTEQQETASWDEILKQRSDWWSLHPVKKPALPNVTRVEWSENAIDRFLLTKMEEAGLEPAGEVDPRRLARRLSLVLTGLPPSREQTDGLVRETAANGGRFSRGAVERLVDELLKSPRFGERWARHWMDVVRFSETHGNEWNYEVHHAWRYRDYLIRAFNEDLPYDQFVREHIAGDLLERPRWNATDQFNESVIGTAFYRFGEANHDDCIGLPQIGYDLADNQIDTLTKAFQGMTVACARCHDHKLDAVSMQDYYGLLGILRSSRQVSHTIDAPEVNAERVQRLLELKREIQTELQEVWQRDARQVRQYLLASRASFAGEPQGKELERGLDPARLQKWMGVLKGDKLPTEHPLRPWQELVTGTMANPGMVAEEWKKIQETGRTEAASREGFNRGKFVELADFRAGFPDDWQIGGQGLQNGVSQRGEIVLTPEGDIGGVLPAGAFTKRASEKLNGTIRSPVLDAEKRYVSFLVSGERSSALRLVTNNCQLNYKNYRALISPNLQWITFQIPEGAKKLRVYAELMTMFDNPKFPDQLSALGGDKANYKLPWEKAAENPRSWFGVIRVVEHETAEPPKLELGALRSQFEEFEVSSYADVADRISSRITTAVEAWRMGNASDEDIAWLDGLVRGGLLSISNQSSEKLSRLSAEYRETEGAIELPRVVPGLADCGPGFEQAILVRGDCMRPGEGVPRRFVEVLSNHEEFKPEGSGRRQLAEMIASPSNPLTARVMVNRLWHHLFGTGLVKTVDDFGHVGERPTHPELLDYLAARFVEEGWSIKRMIREIVLSRAFQLENRPSEKSVESDPYDRLLAHYPARRMEAEAIRDLILATSGRLDGTMYGMSVQPWREKENADRRLFPGPLDGGGRRSIYIKNNLMETPKFLGAFNFPGGKVTQGRRDLSNVPAQALTMLNDPFVLEQAEIWGKRVVENPQGGVDERVAMMFETAMNRPPSEVERLRFGEGIAQFAELHQVPMSEVLQNPEVWKEVAHAMFNLSEFIYIP